MNSAAPSFPGGSAPIAQWLRSWPERWLAFAPRERAALCALGAVPGLLLLSSLDASQSQRLKAAQAQASSAEAQLEQWHKLQAQSQKSAREAKVPSPAELQAQGEELARLREKAQAAKQRWVRAPEMAERLRSLSDTHPKVQLLALKAGLEPKRLPSGAYRHDIDIEVQGSYAEVAHFAHQLSQSSEPWRWQQLTMQRLPSEGLRAKFALFTLSEDASWIAF